MFTIRETKRYTRWMKKLKDRHAYLRIAARIERLEQGNLGDHKNLGDISELKIDYGPGYRIYYTQHGEEIIILLVGGNKQTQARDIKIARSMVKRLRKGKTDD